MNYLELCQQVVRDGAIIGGNANKPETVDGQTGLMKLVVDWVDRANRVIQATWTDYTFRSREVDIEVTANSDKIITTGIERINQEGVYARTNSQRKKMHCMSWTAFRHLRSTTTLPVVDALPDRFAVDPAGDIHVYPISSNEYILRCECVAQPQILANDDDIPWIPEAYHEAIIYRALMYFFAHDEATALYNEADQNYQHWMEKLDGACLPHHDMHSTSTLETPLQMYVE